MKKGLFALLTLALLALAACGERDGTGRELRYLPEDVSFTTELNRAESACISGDSLYLLGAVREPVAREDTGTVGAFSAFRRRAERGSGSPLRPPSRRGMTTICTAPLSAPGRTGRSGCWMIRS